MQKLIAKYGTSAHLAVLAAAPLLIFPFCSEASIAAILLWLSVPSLAWVVLEPSIRTGETLHGARRRVVKAILSDPLFWVSLFLILAGGTRALNDGIALVYDAESTQWRLSPPAVSILPGCAAGTGSLPFAVLVAGTILMQGCRHSLGRSARMAFLLLSSTLAGLAATVAIFDGTYGNVVVRSAIACSATASFYVGLAFFLHLLGGTVALYAAFERKWNLVMPLFVFSIGGTAAAGFLFSPIVVTLVFAVAEVLLLSYVFFYAVRTLPAAGEFKLLVVSGLSFALGCLLVMALEPGATQERVNAVKSLEFLTDSFIAVRTALSGVALRSWLSNLWLGTGLGSFPLAFRFHAVPSDWQLVRAGAQAVPNGWWLLLAERGIVGALFIGLPVGFLAFTYVHRLIGWIGLRTACHPCCLLTPLVMGTVAVTGLYGCALFRADVLILAVALLAVSANSFPRAKRKDNG